MLLLFFGVAVVADALFFFGRLRTRLEASFLADERPGVRAVGLDTASLDFGPSTDFAFHVGWLPTGRYGIENLTRLDDVPPRGAILVVGAPKLQTGSGGPSRILALL